MSNFVRICDNVDLNDLVREILRIGDSLTVDLNKDTGELRFSIFKDNHFQDEWIVNMPSLMSADIEKIF